MFDHLIQLIEAEQQRLVRRRRRLYWRRLGVAVGILLLVAVVFTFTIGFSTVQGQSMFPALQQGDVAVYFRRPAGYDAGDIVVFSRQSGPDLIKRVIAVGGDVVAVDEATGKLTVNGLVLNEPYTVGTGRHPDSVTYPITVPEGDLFVAGDNRDISLDSRNEELGTVSITDVRGLVVTVLRTSL